MKRQKTDITGETKHDIDAVKKKHRKQKLPFTKTSNQQIHTLLKPKTSQIASHVTDVENGSALPGLKRAINVGKKDITVKCANLLEQCMW